MSEFNPARRAFFSKFQVEQPPEAPSFPRPPCAQEEVTFLRLCNQCGDCVKACPSNRIQLDNSFPTIESRTLECKSCMACVFACKTGALKRFGLSIKVDYRCNPKIAQYCQSCMEVCEQQALTISAGESPRVDSDKCNSCGQCVDACDFNAISLR